MDRAMLGGKIDDVGIGPLYGLYDYHYETVALLMHVEHLEAVVGVGPQPSPSQGFCLRKASIIAAFRIL
jgi:hypothetical protein